MLAVIFEVHPVDGRRQDYLDLAAELRDELKLIDGFISVERFESLSQPGKLLSLSYWRDEDAIAAWRNVDRHRAAQARGRAEILADYQLKIAHVVRSYGKTERDQAPADSRLAHEG